MTLAAVSGNSITLGSTPSYVCNMPTSSQIAVGFSSSKVQIWDITTRSQVGSDITFGNAITSMEYAGNNKLAIMNSSTTCYFLDTSTTTITTLASMALGQGTQKGNLIAAIPSSNVAYGCSNTTGKIVKFDSSGVTATLMSPSWLDSHTAVAVVAKGTSGFIFATVRDVIVETDTSLNLVKSYKIPNVKGWLDVSNAGSASTIGAQNVGCMSYYNGYLLVSTMLGQIILFDHDAGMELQRFTSAKQSQSGNSPFGTVFTNSSDQVVVYATPPNNSTTQLCEIDLLLTPIKPTGSMSLDSSITSGCYQIGLNGTNGWVARASNGNKIYCFTVSGKRSVSFSSTATVGSAGGEIITINDAGVGNAATGVQFDSGCPAAGKAIPYTTGSTLLKLGITTAEGAIGIHEQSQALR